MQRLPGRVDCSKRTYTLVDLLLWSWASFEGASMLIRRSPFNILIRGFNSICRTGPTRRAAWSGYSFSEDALFVRRMFAGEKEREGHGKAAHWNAFANTRKPCGLLGNLYWNSMSMHIHNRADGKRSSSDDPVDCCTVWIPSTRYYPPQRWMATRHRRLCVCSLLNSREFRRIPSIAEPSTIGAANILMPRIRLKRTRIGCGAVRWDRARGWSSNYIQKRGLHNSILNWSGNLRQFSSSSGRVLWR